MEGLVVWASGGGVGRQPPEEARLDAGATVAVPDDDDERVARMNTLALASVGIEL